jgi:hypothetical protein
MMMVFAKSIDADVLIMIPSVNGINKKHETMRTPRIVAGLALCIQTILAADPGIIVIPTNGLITSSLADNGLKIDTMPRYGNRPAADSARGCEEAITTIAWLVGLSSRNMSYDERIEIFKNTILPTVYDRSPESTNYAVMCLYMSHKIRWLKQHREVDQHRWDQDMNPGIMQSLLGKTGYQIHTAIEDCEFYIDTFGLEKLMFLAAPECILDKELMVDSAAAARIQRLSQNVPRCDEACEAALDVIQIGLYNMGLDIRKYLKRPTDEARAYDNYRVPGGEGARTNFMNRWAYDIDANNRVRKKRLPLKYQSMTPARWALEQALNMRTKNLKSVAMFLDMGQRVMAPVTEHLQNPTWLPKERREACVESEIKRRMREIALEITGEPTMRGSLADVPLMWKGPTIDIGVDRGTALGEDGPKVTHRITGETVKHGVIIPKLFIWERQISAAGIDGGMALGEEASETTRGINREPITCRDAPPPKRLIWSGRLFDVDGNAPGGSELEAICEKVGAICEEIQFSVRRRFTTHVALRWQPRQLEVDLDRNLALWESLLDTTRRRIKDICGEPEEPTRGETQESIEPMPKARVALHWRWHQPEVDLDEDQRRALEPDELSQRDTILAIGIAQEADKLSQRDTALATGITKALVQGHKRTLDCRDGRVFGVLVRPGQSDVPIQITVNGENSITYGAKVPKDPIPCDPGNPFPYDPDNSSHRMVPTKISTVTGWRGVMLGSYQHPWRCYSELRSARIGGSKEQEPELDPYAPAFQLILCVHGAERGRIEIKTRPRLEGIRHAGTSVEIRGEELMNFDSEARMPIPLKSELLVYAFYNLRRYE